MPGRRQAERGGVLVSPRTASNMGASGNKIEVYIGSCIYRAPKGCGSKLTKEHVIPECLSDKEQFILLRGACKDCNNNVASPLDQQFASAPLQMIQKACLGVQPKNSHGRPTAKPRKHVATQGDPKSGKALRTEADQFQRVLPEGIRAQPWALELTGTLAVDSLPQVVTANQLLACAGFKPELHWRGAAKIAYAAWWFRTQPTPAWEMRPRDLWRYVVGDGITDWPIIPEQNQMTLFDVQLEHIESLEVALIAVGNLRYATPIVAPDRCHWPALFTDMSRALADWDRECKACATSTGRKA